MIRQFLDIIKAYKPAEVAGYSKLFSPIVFIIMIAIGVDGFVEYNTDGFSSPFFIKDVLNNIIILLAYVLFLFEVLSNRAVVVVASYSILISMMSSLYLRYNMEVFVFEPYFLKVEIILMILTFAIGVLVHPMHKIIILSVNIVFILVCILIVQVDYPIEKFGFYAFMISCTGIAGFAVHIIFIRLTNRVNQANQYITIQNKELKELNESKDHLFRIIGHDLKTPFAQLSSLLVLMDSVDCEIEKQEFTQMMQDSIENGDRLLMSLLNWANIDSSQSLTQFELLPISDITDKVFDFFTTSSSAKNIQLENHIDKSLNISMDSKMMETILRNLISNAIKFSEKGGKIKVVSKENEEEFCISVIDNGVGMNEKTIRALFQPGVRVSNNGTDNETGTGFGLSICKKMIENQKGAMRVSSTINIGTTVDICIPKS